MVGQEGRDVAGAAADLQDGAGGLGGDPLEQPAIQRLSAELVAEGGGVGFGDAVVVRWDVHAGSRGGLQPGQR